MLTAEFDRPAGRTPMVTAPVTPFPDAGAPEGAVLGGIRERLGDNPFDIDRDFGNSYSGIPHPITHQLDELMRSTWFVEWAAEQQPGTLALEREAVRMVAALLGAPEGAGFLTSGGTESNLAALRLARCHGGQAEPEVVAPVTMHFSFRMGAELMRIGLVEVGFKQRPVPSAIDGARPGKRESIHGGSWFEAALGGVHLSRALTFCAFVQATNPLAGERQVIASQGRPFDGAGGALALSARGELQVIGADGVVARLGPMRRWQWYLVALSLRAGEDGAGRDGGGPAVAGTAWRRAVRAWPDDPPVAATVAGDALLPPPAAPLLLAAARNAAGATVCHLDGRIDRPRLLAGTVAGAQLEAWAAAPDDNTVLAGGTGLVGAWEFSRDVESDRARDVSGNDRHGRVFNLPARAVTGHNFGGEATCFRLAPERYGAIHFHRDDLEDAGWAADFSLRIPRELPSGIYAAWLQTDDGAHEEYLPFVVRPPRGRRRAPIAVLMSTLTYQCYANFTDLGVGAWREGATGAWPSNAPFADPSLSRDLFRYIDENALYGQYDLHLDGSGVIYGSLLKPNLTMRPKFRYRTMAVPTRFAADLYLVDWLDAKGIEVDYLTDHDLHAEGAELLARYRVVISSSHHEYWTGRMLDALEQYLGGGGRFMYLAGNGLFGVASIDPARPHVMELRRWGTSWPFEVHPAERYHSTSGEPGGIWRNRGRAPNRLVGVGTAGAEFGPGVPFQRQPDSRDPRVAFIFAGIGDDELIGDFPNLQVAPRRRRLRVRPRGGRARLAARHPGAGLVGGLRRAPRQPDGRRTAVVHRWARRRAPRRPAATRPPAPLRARRHRLPGVSQRRRGVLRRRHLLARSAVLERLRQQRVPDHRERPAGVRVFVVPVYSPQRLRDSAMEMAALA